MLYAVASCKGNDHLAPRGTISDGVGGVGNWDVAGSMGGITKLWVFDLECQNLNPKQETFF